MYSSIITTNPCQSLIKINEHIIPLPKVNRISMVNDSELNYFSIHVIMDDVRISLMNQSKDIVITFDSEVECKTYFDYLWESLSN